MITVCNKHVIRDNAIALTQVVHRNRNLVHTVAARALPDLYHTHGHLINWEYSFINIEDLRRVPRPYDYN